MTFLLDTNVISELRKGPRADAGVLAWFEAAPPEEIALSVLTLGEIRRGIESVRTRDPKQATSLEDWLTRLARDYSERIIPIDRAVAEEWGRLTTKRAGSVVDVLLAATCRVHGLTLVTRNVADVTWTGVSVVNPFG